jgi:hypothetical protein
MGKAVDENLCENTAARFPQASIEISMEPYVTTQTVAEVLGMSSRTIAKMAPEAAESPRIP